MASTIRVDKLDPQSGTALEIGTSGDTVTVPTGAGLTVVDEVKTNKISPATGTAFALGDSGDTFTVPSGATIVNSGTATGFGGGKIGQVVQTTKLDRDTTTSTSFVAISGVTVNITPTATNSKILVQFSGTFGVHSNYTGVVRLVQLISGGSDVYPYLGATGLTTPNRGTVIFGGSNFDSRDYPVLAFEYLDSPSTTSEITYSLEWYMESGGTGYLNRSGQDISASYHAAIPSSITVMEVLA
jgi:hypothetical protein